MNNFNLIINRRETGSVKWLKYPPDVLPMWVADMDFLSPPAVTEALSEKINQGIFGYPQIESSAKDAVVNWLDERHHWQVDQEEVIFLPSVVVGFNLAAHAVARPGDGVLIQEPAYGPFFDVAQNAGIDHHSTALSRDDSGRFHLNPDQFLADIQENTRLFMLCNPQNPTGRVLTREELEWVAKASLDHDLIVCSDEIHSDIIYPPHKHIPFAALGPEIAERTITLIAPSKTFNLAGLKSAAAVITNPELRKKYLQARQGLVGKTNILGMIALQAAYSHGAPWLDSLLVYLNQNRLILLDFLDRELPELSCFSPQGTFLAWIDCRGTGLSSPQEFFLKKGRVAFNDGKWFGDRWEGFIRLNFGCPRAQLLEGLQRIKNALAER